MFVNLDGKVSQHSSDENTHADENLDLRTEEPGVGKGHDETDGLPETIVREGCFAATTEQVTIQG